MTNKEVATADMKRLLLLLLLLLLLVLLNHYQSTTATTATAMQRKKLSTGAMATGVAGAAIKIIIKRRRLLDLTFGQPRAATIRKNLFRLQAHTQRHKYTHTHTQCQVMLSRTQCGCSLHVSANLRCRQACQMSVKSF